MNLEYAQAGETAKILHETYGPTSRTLRISADLRTNTLILAAPPEKLLRITSLLRELDRPVDVKLMRPMVFKLRFAKADDLSETIGSLVAGMGSVRADKRTNSLVVTAPDLIMPDVRSVITQLDIQVPDKG